MRRNLTAHSGKRSRVESGAMVIESFDSDAEHALIGIVMKENLSPILESIKKIETTQNRMEVDTFPTGSQNTTQNVSIENTIKQQIQPFVESLKRLDNNQNAIFATLYKISQQIKSSAVVSTYNVSARTQKQPTIQ